VHPNGRYKRGGGVLHRHTDDYALLSASYIISASDAAHPCYTDVDFRVFAPDHVFVEPEAFARRETIRIYLRWTAAICVRRRRYRGL
jgi:hypothetical protein